MRQFCAALLIAGGALALLPSSSFAQSSFENVTPQTATPAKKTDDNSSAEEESGADETESDPDKKTKETIAKLDEKLLGAWAEIATVASNLTEQLIRTAATKCLTPVKVQKLNIESVAERKLPKPANLFGDLIYFRTGKGLQRFHIKSGLINLLSDVRKATAVRNKSVWVLRGRTTGFRIRFSDAAKRGVPIQFLLEENKVYLRCKSIVRPDGVSR